MVLLEVSELNKSFGQVQAVQSVSFSVKAGEVFTIIGPNGAGKTTTLEMIEGMLHPDKGTIVIDGLTWDKHREQIKIKIGIQPQSSAMYELLTIEENLDLFASFYPNPKKVTEVLELINLTEHRKKQVKSLSGGQRQRLAIGLAIISNPQIIFLDEPTTGLDPQARRNIWDIILKWKESGKTTILTTHYMEEAEILSDRVCIVDQGRIIALDTTANLIDQLSNEREVRLSFIDGDAAAITVNEKIMQEATVVRTKQVGNTLHIWTIQPEDTLYKLFGFTQANELRVEQVAIREKSLEDVFIHFTGKEWRD
jgi:ABC-2 type transport system ATP-binding protein